LIEYFALEKTLKLPPEEAPSSGSEPRNEEVALRDVLAFLRSRTGRDFSYYKRATVVRRIARRMQVCGVEDLVAYLGCLRTTPREASYPLTIEADVSEELLRRYFTKGHDGYKVRRELREMVLFARHDLLKDSPFSRLDLISCRNLLIYLNRDAQRRVFDIFHF